MGETRIFSVPDSGATAANNSIAAMLPALLQNRGIDTAALMGMMSNGNGGFFGKTSAVDYDFDSYTVFIFHPYASFSISELVDLFSATC